MGSQNSLLGKTVNEAEETTKYRFHIVKRDGISVSGKPLSYYRGCRSMWTGQGCNCKRLKINVDSRDRIIEIIGYV